LTPTDHRSVPDGTTGRDAQGGRRTHIIQILRDSREPLSVQEVADKVSIHINTARFHLESLVEAGLADRQTEARSVPGRPKVVYSGTLPNQTHERAMGYRLLSEMLTTAIAKSWPEAGTWLYQVGHEWGRYLTSRPAPFEDINEAEISGRLVDKLDALWFAPEVMDEPGATSLLLHNCPFYDSARRFPDVVCQLHAGMVNGSLEEMGSGQRLNELTPQTEHHRCIGTLGPTPAGPETSVTLHTQTEPD